MGKKSAAAQKAAQTRAQVVARQQVPAAVPTPATLGIAGAVSRHVASILEKPADDRELPLRVLGVAMAVIQDSPVHTLQGADQMRLVDDTIALGETDALRVRQFVSSRVEQLRQAETQSAVYQRLMAMDLSAAAAAAAAAAAGAGRGAGRGGGLAGAAGGARVGHHAAGAKQTPATAPCNLCHQIGHWQRDGPLRSQVAGPAAGANAVPLGQGQQLLLGPPPQR